MKNSVFKRLKLEKIKGVDIEKLMLDPDNPRFCKHPKDVVNDNKIGDKDIQEETFRRMQHKNFEITSLKESIKSKGFVPVDNIFVRKIKNKYLIVEGNRRITAIKILLLKHKEGKDKDKIPSEILKTLTKIDCFDLSNNTKEEIDFVLGLRHHGSIKKWDFLPSAFNIYKRYMEEYCTVRGVENIDENFSYESTLVKFIKSLYSLEMSEVRNKLRAYRVYLQLRELSNDENLEKRFSIIHDAIKDKTLRRWFGFDEDLCTFSDEGADLFIDLVCSDAQDPVIIAAAAGESNLRDLSYVVSEGTEEDIKEITELRKMTSFVKADVKNRKNERNLSKSLELALQELGKIKLGEDFEGLGEAEKEILEEIQDIINKIKKLAEKK